MASPKSKISRSRRGMRRSHNALNKLVSRSCRSCDALHLPHRVCLNCGYYDGQEIVTAKSVSST